MHELRPADYPHVLPLFQVMDYNLAVDAILQGSVVGHTSGTWAVDLAMSVMRMACVMVNATRALTILSFTMSSPLVRACLECSRAVAARISNPAAARHDVTPVLHPAGGEGSRSPIG